jgi:hypothetical protein
MKLQVRRQQSFQLLKSLGLVLLGLFFWVVGYALLGAFLGLVVAPFVHCQSPPNWQFYLDFSAILSICVGLIVGSLVGLIQGLRILIRETRMGMKIASSSGGI